MRALITVLLLLGSFALSAEEQPAETKSRRPRIRLGGVTVGAGYSHFSGYPGFWGYPYWTRAFWPGAWYFPYYDPWWSSAFFHPGYFTSFVQGPNMGEVRLRTPRKDLTVYLDGAYAGTADKLKSMWLDPGAYNLELRTNGDSYTKRIYVLSGKRLTIDPEFPKPAKEARP